MQLLPSEFVLARLKETGATVNHLHVTKDQNALVYQAEYQAHEDQIRSIPALFVILCLSGGGQIYQRTANQEIHGEIAPGDIGVLPPHSTGIGRWPQMNVISIGISIDSLIESFGLDWPTKVKPSVTSQLFRDPLVEATMTDIGYTRAGQTTDATLLHAAHMTAHQLLDRPFDGTVENSDIAPLGKLALREIETALTQNLERHMTVGEMADLVGVSQYHFSRRFKAATGQTPHQYAINRKLDHAVKLLEEDEKSNIISIAQKIGYENSGQFARVFRKRFGLTPGGWRKRNLN